MTISVTGASGDIGGAYINNINNETLVKILVRKNSEVPLPTRAKSYSFTDGFTYDDTFLKDFLDTDTLIHCAALLNANDHDSITTIATNAMLTGLLAFAAMRHNVKKMVYISSEMVYGLPRGDTALVELSEAFIDFCRKNFEYKKPSYDLRTLAEEFVNENKDFPFSKYNTYALAKYLGEVAVQETPNFAILRVSNAYGPEYTNPRLIPRMIKSRLTGHNMDYVNEMRDFVYSKDINSLISSVIQEDTTGIIDCKSNEILWTEEVANLILHATPTAYGELHSTSKKDGDRFQSDGLIPARVNLSDIIGDVTPFQKGFAETIRRHKEKGYHQMIDSRTLQDFLEPDERTIEVLKGSSAAHLCVVADLNNTLKVRKIAIYDGVEGNGIAKVANEIKYYQHIAENEKGLASMYPILLDSKLDETFSLETIEYLDGKNYYQSIKDGDLPEAVHRKSLQNFVNTLCDHALEKTQPSKDPAGNLDGYYIERSLSRLAPINDIIEIKDVISINGENHIAPHIILTDLLANEPLRSLVTPQIETFCFHGDLTFLNTVLVDESQEIRLIDPRGYIGNWDPLYDFGKLQFTLAGFGEFVVSNKPMATQISPGSYTAHFDQIPELSLKLRDELFDVLADNKTFKEKIINKEPHWRLRIALAEATHFLADIPFRLFTDGTTSTALSSYVIGTYYLNQVYKELKNEAASR